MTSVYLCLQQQLRIGRCRALFPNSGCFARTSAHNELVHFARVEEGGLARDAARQQRALGGAHERGARGGKGQQMAVKHGNRAGEEKIRVEMPDSGRGTDLDTELERGDTAGSAAALAALAGVVVVVVDVVVVVVVVAVCLQRGHDGT
jgi:hypothetical protein